MGKKSASYAPKAGDLVFAKVKGYPPWPARVNDKDPNGKKVPNNKIPVVFFGTYESAIVAINDLFPYLQFKEMYGQKKKNNSFNIGMEEIEQAANLPASDAGSDGEEEEDMKIDIDAPQEQTLPINGSSAHDDTRFSLIVDKAAEISANDDISPVSETATQSEHEPHLNGSADPEEMEATDEPSLSDYSDSEEPALVIDETLPAKKSVKTKANSKTLKKGTWKTVSTRAPETPVSSAAKRRTLKRKLSEVENSPSVLLESPAVQTETPSASTSTVERSRSGRMIKRKKMADYEDEYDSYSLGKRKSNGAKPIASTMVNKPSKPSHAKKVEKAEPGDNESAVADVDDHEASKTISVATTVSETVEASTPDLEDMQSESAESLGIGSILLDSEEKREKWLRKFEEKEREKERLKKEKLEQKKLKKLQAIEVTPEILKGFDKDIQTSLEVGAENIDKCLSTMDRLDKLQITKDPLIEYHDLILTLKKCRRFGKDERVRTKSEELYSKFRSLVKGGENDNLVSKPSSSKADVSREASSTESCDKFFTPEEEDIRSEVHLLMQNLLVNVS